MNKQIVVALIAGLIIGGLATFGIVSANSSNNMMSSEATPNSDSMGDNNSGSMVHDAGGTGSMADMNPALQGKTGDEFDKEFISQMIIHHQGAIDMAQTAKQNAGRQEIKDLADDIITAQQNEIKMMTQWQKDWGYIE